jgi:hypothetical protein
VGLTAISFGAVLQAIGALDTDTAHDTTGRVLSVALVLLALTALFASLLRWPTVVVAVVALAWQVHIASAAEGSSGYALGFWAGVVGIVLCALGALVAPSAGRHSTAT